MYIDYILFSIPLHYCLITYIQSSTPHKQLSIPLFHCTLISGCPTQILLIYTPTLLISCDFQCFDLLFISKNPNLKSIFILQKNYLENFSHQKYTPPCISFIVLRNFRFPGFQIPSFLFYTLFIRKLIYL